MGRFLGRLQDPVVQQFTGRLLQRRNDGKWEHTLVEAAREEVVIEAMEEYIWRSQNRVAQFIGT